MAPPTTTFDPFFQWCTPSSASTPLSQALACADEHWTNRFCFESEVAPSGHTPQTFRLANYRQLSWPQLHGGTRWRLRIKSTPWFTYSSPTLVLPCSPKCFHVPHILQCRPILNICCRSVKQIASSLPPIAISHNLDTMFWWVTLSNCGGRYVTLGFLRVLCRPCG